MDIEANLQIASLSKVIFYFMIGIFVLAFIIGFSSQQNNRPLKKKKVRIVLTVVSLLLSPLIGTIISIPIRISLELDPHGFYPGLASIGGNLAIISFVIMVCFIWFVKRDSRA